MDYMSTAEASAKWDTTQSVVQKWCRKGRIPGAKQERNGGPWYIPADAEPPDRTDREAPAQINTESFVQAADSAPLSLKEALRREIKDEVRRIEQDMGRLNQESNRKNRDTVQPQITKLFARKSWLTGILEKYK